MPEMSNIMVVVCPECDKRTTERQDAIYDMTNGFQWRMGTCEKCLKKAKKRKR